MVGTYDEDGWSHNVTILIVSAVIYSIMLLIAAVIEAVIKSETKPGDDFHEIRSNLLFSVDSLMFQHVKRFNMSHANDTAFLRIFPSLAVCVIYVVNTYTTKIHPVTYLFLASFAVSMLVFLFMQIPIDNRPWVFVWRFECVVEVISLVSLLLSRGDHYLNPSFLQAHIVLTRFLEVLPTLAALFWKKPDPHLQQKIRFAAYFFSLVYIFASGLQLFERLGDPVAVFRSTSLELTMWNALYFTFVTVFTVGYGDFIPYTLFGRTWMVFVVTIGVLLVSYKISKFHEYNLAFSCGEGSYVKQEGVKHCVICGNIKWEYLKAFIEEFYSDHENFDTELVVMSSRDDWAHQQEATKFFRKSSLFFKRVSIFNGACMIEEDLIRSKVRSARAVFVLSNQHNPNIYAEDSETLKRILTIRSHSPETPIFAMCALTDSMFQIVYALEHSGVNDDDEGDDSRGHSSDDDSDGMVATVFEGPSEPRSEAICMQDLEMSMLAANIYCNGMSTLLSNLLLFTVPTKDPADEEEPWLKEYKAGTENSFHIVKIPGVLDNIVYSEIALTFIDHGVVLLATKKYWSKKNVWEPLTPQTKLSHSSIGLVMTFMARIDLQTLMQSVADRWARSTASSYRSGSQGLLTDDFSMRTSSWHEIAGRFLTGDGRIDYLDDDYNDGSGFQEGNDDDNNNAVEGHGMVNNPFVSPPYGTQYPEAVPDESFDLPAAAYDQYERSQGLEHFSRDIQENENEQAAPTDSTDSLGRRKIDYLLDSEVVQPTQRTVGWNVEARRPQSARPSTQSHIGWDATTSPKRSAINRTPATGGWHASTSPSRSVLRRGPKVVFSRDAAPTALPRSPTIASGLGERRPGPSLRPESRSKSEQCLPLLQRTDEPKASKETADTPQVVQILTDMSSTLAEYHENNNEERIEDRYDDGPSSKELRFHQRRKSGDRVVYPGNIGPGCGSLDDGASLGKRSTNSFGTIEHKIHVSYGDQTLPETFKNHVVVCVIGSMGMMNLKRFLACLNRARRKQVKLLQVIAICPVVSEDHIQELEELTAENSRKDVKQIHISLIQGNSLSISTLKCAQCETASSIVILACEDKNIASHIDSQTIYTVMSLDHLLEENANTFVCSMIDSEESMHLLRAPQKQRLRIGDLGALPGMSGLMRKKSFRSMRALGTFRSQYSMRSMQSERLPRGKSVYDLSRTESMAASKLRQSRSFFIHKNKSETLNRAVSSGGAVLRARPSIAMDMNLHLTGGGGSYQLPRYPSFNAAPLLTRMSTVNRSSWMGGRSKSFARTHTNIAGLNTEFGNAPGVGVREQFIPKKSRDDAFEKERYASGELMISSMFIALLIREVSMPGLTSVVSTLFGTRYETQPCWVRSIPVPKHWMAVPEGEVVEYRDLCEKLLQHSCIPLGLYRCGAAPIRVFCPEDDDEGGLFDYIAPEAPSYRDTSLSNSQEELEEEGERAKNETSSPMYPDRQVSPSQVRPMGEDKRGSEASMAMSMDGFRLGDTEEYGEYQFVTSDRRAAYRVHSNGFNVLPYVYTNPEPYTVVSKHDAIFVLADPSLDLDEEFSAKSKPNT